MAKKEDIVYVTDDELLRLLKEQKIGQILSAPYAASRPFIFNVPGNNWAFEKLIEWRTVAKKSEIERGGECTEKK